MRRTLGHDLLRHRLGLAGLAMVGLLIAFCVLGPILHPTDQVHTNIALTNLGPSPRHPLGTDAEGYDELGRLMVGGRATLEIALAVAALATLLGTLWGAVAGLAGGALDALMMRIVDTLLALPAIFVLIYLATIVQPTVPLLIGVIALLSWLGPARLIRGETLSLRTREFIEAARAMGAGRGRTIARHILPNTVGTLVVSATFQVADAIILLATLSFLGFGLAPPAATWGGMLYQGTSYLLDGYWWEVYPAGVLLMVTVIAFNLIGGALRDVLDGDAAGGDAAGGDGGGRLRRARTPAGPPAPARSAASRARSATSR
ncbi:MAG TPA: ABC transporter permease [Solirubrobacteraceae bacterium]|nr:ABC transporter permease [Solirubrobacteraceae bacterium]